MGESYTERLRAKKNLCDYYMDQAQQTFFDNGKVHTREECAFLQQAANLRSEMAQMSVDAERKHHLAKLQQLNQAIEVCRRECDPDYLAKENAFRQAQAQAQGKPAGKPAAGQAAAQEEVKKKPAASKREAISDEEVEKWYREAPSHSFDDVSGMTELKKKLKSCIEASKNNKLREFLKMKSVHSFFFIGPPGCGKTYIIEAFAHELMQKDYKFLSLDASNIRSKYVGDAEKIVKRMFEEAVKSAPCIVFVDEIESVCKNRSLPDLPEYASAITTAFLTGYNIISNTDKNIIFIGATNYPNLVDNAMLDRVEKIRVPFPDEGARAAAFERSLGKIFQLESDLTFKHMAEMTPTYNYRDIDHVIEALKDVVYDQIDQEYGHGEEAIEAITSGDYRISLETFDDVIEKVLPTPKDDIIRDLDVWEQKFKTRALMGD